QQGRRPARRRRRGAARSAAGGDRRALSGAGAATRQAQRARLRGAYPGTACRDQGRDARGHGATDVGQFLRSVRQGAASAGLSGTLGMSITVTILGCGSSGGVPRIPDDWGACDRSNPRNRRRRCSILATRTGGKGTTAILVDTSPDLREQLIDARIGWLDSVFITHEHADHIHGIDDLRMVAMNGRRRVPVYAARQTMELLHTRFEYCFRTPAGSEYPPILDGAILEPSRPVTVDGP